MDRLAYQNMTSRGKGPYTSRVDVPDDNQFQETGMAPFNFTNELPFPQNSSTEVNDQQAYFDHNNNRGGASLNSFSQPTGAVTSKSKMNTQINHYYLERQSKNSPNYTNFVSALNNNIKEDQQRTTVNNDRLRTEQKEVDNFQRVYHPGLSGYHKDQNTDSTEFERIGLGVCTRDKRENSLAKNKNTPHVDLQYSHQNNGLPQPPPKLNYPQGYDQLKPMTMDMTSHLEMQFQTLTNPDMDQQIVTLQQKSQKQDPQAIQGQSPMDRQTYFQAKGLSAYNPHVDHLNQQLQQMSLQMPEGKNSIALQMQNMNSMHNLSNIPNMPSVDPINFQRPTSSNTRPVQNQQMAPYIPQSQYNYQMPPMNQQMPPMNQQMPPMNLQMPPMNQQMQPMNLQMSQQTGFTAWTPGAQNYGQ